MILPHRYPFQLVDRSAGRARLLLTAGAYWLRGGDALGLPFLIEAAAQAAAVALAPAGASRGDLLLAGISDCELKRLPRAGDALEFELAVEGRLGAIVRVGAVVRSEGEEISRLSLTLSGLVK